MKQSESKTEKTMIISNQVECLKCGDKPFSMSVHHTATCKCGSISVDSTDHHQLKRSGDLDNYKDISIEAPQSLVQALTDQVGLSTSAGRNDYGVALGVFRAIRDAGYKIVKVDGE